MTKKNNFDHVTPELVKRVEAVLDEATRHKYSVSRVYGAHNAVFKKNDIPQTCSSCLRNRVRELKAFYKDYKPKSKPFADGGLVGEAVVPEAPAAEVEPNAPADQTIPAPNNVLSIKDKEGVVSEALFTSEDGVKGVLTYGDGSKVKAGTYSLIDGNTVAVQPGGKATIKTIEDDLT